jgi:hypothetical protein
MPHRLSVRSPRTFGLVLALLTLFVPIGVLAQSQAQTGAAAADATMEEPSEAEIATAYDERIAHINARSREVLGDEQAEAMLLTLEALKKLRCDGLDRVGVHFDCRVEMRVRQADRRPKTTVVDLWLSYENGNWIAR